MPSSGTLRVGKGACGFLVSASLLGCLAAGGETIALVLPGDPAPDGNGTFVICVNLSFNDAAQVSFTAGLDGTSRPGVDNIGLFRAAGGGALVQIVRRGDAVPGRNGSFGNLGPTQIGPAAQVSFDAVLNETSGGSTDDKGIFVGSGGPLVPIIREGQSIAGGGTIAALGSLRLGTGGHAVAAVTLSGTAGGILDNSAIFLGTGGPLTQVARKGAAAPDGNGTYSTFGFPAINPNGLVFFPLSWREPAVEWRTMRDCSSARAGLSRRSPARATRHPMATATLLPSASSP